jgi:endoglucanase
MRPRNALVVIAALAAASIGLATSATPRQPPLERDEWLLYQNRFITADGRVVDTGNGGISHSEGQGYGMLLAVAYDDRPQFDRLWRWTVSHLQVRHDRLFAWKWKADAPTGEEVTDRNSAADGDLLIAWALARAGARWQEPRYLAAARGIASDILKLLSRKVGDRRVLLPGPEGFVHGRVATVNLSYWVFPALRELARAVPSPAWEELATSGVELVRAARFGARQLPPDWLALTDPPRPSRRFPPVFGYNAIRIPLHLVWAGIDAADLLQPFVDYAAAEDAPPPATVNLVSGTASADRLSSGGEAVLTLARIALGGERIPLPDLQADMDYFASSLLLLSKLALAERFPT